MKKKDKSEEVKRERIAQGERKTATSVSDGTWTKKEPIQFGGGSRNCFYNFLYCLKVFPDGPEND